ncbi:MAG: oxidoreductase [Candidatus Binatia bacterium]|nr:MAG: oxidoreductase [Candidatus Binatia bacterium]
MRVLVTGAAGFLGQALVEEFARHGSRVRALVHRSTPPTWPGEVEVVSGDLGSPDFLVRAVENVDAIVHAAARVSTEGTWEDFAAVNVRGTMSLLEAAGEAGVGCVVHVSSLSVFAVPRDPYTVTDSSPYESESNARGHYSRSKLAADRLALWYAKRGAPVVVLRPGLLWGPGRRPPLARQSFQRDGVRFILARKDYPLPLSHVQSVARAAFLAVERARNVSGRGLNVVDVHVPQRLWVDAYRELSGGSWRPLYLPVQVVAAAAMLAERVLGFAGRRSPVTYHQIVRATRRAYYDCSATKELLGWEPRSDWRSDLQAVLGSLKTDASRQT